MFLVTIGAYFCNQQSNASDTDTNDDSEMISSSLENDESNATIVDSLEAIIVNEIEDSIITEEMEVDARNAYSGMIHLLPEGLFARVLACGDRLVILAEHLIHNETSNLAECYMSIRALL